MQQDLFPVHKSAWKYSHLNRSVFKLRWYLPHSLTGGVQLHGPCGGIVLQVASGGHAALHRNVGWVTLDTLSRPLDFWFSACGGGGTWGRAASNTLSQQDVNLYDCQTGMNNQTLSSHEPHDVSRKQETSCEFWST